MTLLWYCACLGKSSKVYRRTAVKAYKDMRKDWAQVAARATHEEDKTHVHWGIPLYRGFYLPPLPGRRRRWISPRGICPRRPRPISKCAAHCSWARAPHTCSRSSAAPFAPSSKCTAKVPTRPAHALEQARHLKELAARGAVVGAERAVRLRGDRDPTHFKDPVET